MGSIRLTHTWIQGTGLPLGLLPRTSSLPGRVLCPVLRFGFGDLVSRLLGGGQHIRGTNASVQLSSCHMYMLEIFLAI